MLIRCCLILHNLILQIEGGDYDKDFREELYTAGQEDWQQVNGWSEMLNDDEANN